LIAATAAPDPRPSAAARRTALIPRARLVHTEDMITAFNMFAALRQAGCFAADGIAPRQG